MNTWTIRTRDQVSSRSWGDLGDVPIDRTKRLPLQCRPVLTVVPLTLCSVWRPLAQRSGLAESLFPLSVFKGFLQGPWIFMDLRAVFLKPSALSRNCLSGTTWGLSSGLFIASEIFSSWPPGVCRMSSRFIANCWVESKQNYSFWAEGVRLENMKHNKVYWGDGINF